MTANDSDRRPSPKTSDLRSGVRKALTFGEPDALSQDELARLEAWSDVFLDLIGYLERQRADSPAFDDPEFLEWYCGEQRLNHEERPDGEAMVHSESVALARRIRERLQAEQAGVYRVDQAPTERQHASSTTASQMVELLTGTSEAALADLAVAAGAGRALWDIECDTSVELPAHVPRGKYLALRVAGESMMPLMHSGDVVLVKLGPDVRQDSVVVARLPDHGYVVKRVGRLTAAFLELVSLNPEFPSLRIPRSFDPVLGTVVLRWCVHSG